MNNKGSTSKIQQPKKPQTWATYRSNKIIIKQTKNKSDNNLETTFQSTKGKEANLLLPLMHKFDGLQRQL